MRGEGRVDEGGWMRGGWMRGEGRVDEGRGKGG